MLPLIAVLAGLGAMGAYQYGKKKQEAKDKNAIIQAQNNKKEKSIAQNYYTYNNLTDSTTGNTLFDSQQKTKRTLFGASNNV